MQRSPDVRLIIFQLLLKDHSFPRPVSPVGFWVYPGVSYQLDEPPKEGVQVDPEPQKEAA